MFPRAEPNYQGQYLDYLPAYNLSAGLDRLLEVSRVILEDGGYQWRGYAFPLGADILIGARATFTGNIPIIPNSYLISITGYSSQALGFNVRIFDKGARADIIERQFDYGLDLASNMEDQFTPAVTPEDAPFGPNYMLSPLIFLPPGSLQIEIVNLAAAAANIQILLGMAVPITSRALQQVRVEG